MKINSEIEIKTIGDLKQAIKHLNDDTVLLFNDIEGEQAIDIKSIDTHWHGALTFNV